MASGRLGLSAPLLLPQSRIYQPVQASGMDRRGIHPVDRLRISDSSAAKSLRIPAASAAGLPGRVLPGICGGVRSAHRLHRERGRSASIKGLDQAIVRRPLSDPNGSSRYPFGYHRAQRGAGKREPRITPSFVSPCKHWSEIRKRESSRRRLPLAHRMHYA